MSEADLMGLQVDVVAQIWTIIFAWIGTTTGMVAAAYFAAHRFSAALLSGMLGLYIFFTAACVAQLARMWQRVAAIGRDLRNLADSGVALSESSMVALRNIESEMVRSVLLPMIAFIFVVSCIYVVICYRAGRKTDT